MNNTIQIPYQFEPRPYQLDLLKAMDSGYKRAVVVYHRRAGKDKTLFNLVIKKALERKGTYYYLFPEFAMARRVIWTGIDGSGFKFLDHIPKQLIAKENSTDMKIELKNGSIIQLIGTDKFDKVRGSNPIGCVFSEYAWQNPSAWTIIRPILAENGGWSVFNSTPFGKNHFYDLYQMAKDNPDWFTQVVTVEDSVDPDGHRYITEDIIDEERRSGMSEEMIQQEFYCDFTANSQGFYYLKYMIDAEKENRIGNFPYDSDIPVITFWDIGMRDDTAIIFCQYKNGYINIIDYYQNNSVGIEHYAKELQNRRYVYESHNFPHDMKKTEMGTGRSILEVAEELFRGTVINVMPKLDFEDGVNAARILLPKCNFHASKTEKLIKALTNYHREWDDKLKEFKNKPVHDWASHPADAFRYLAIGFTFPEKKKDRKKSMYRQLTARGWMAA
jgi:phage terminase large subunit